MVKATFYSSCCSHTKIERVQICTYLCPSYIPSIQIMTMVLPSTQRNHTVHIVLCKPSCHSSNISDSDSLQSDLFLQTPTNHNCREETCEESHIFLLPLPPPDESFHKDESSVYNWCPVLSLFFQLPWFRNHKEIVLDDRLRDTRQIFDHG